MPIWRIPPPHPSQPTKKVPDSVDTPPKGNLATRLYALLRIVLDLPSIQPRQPTKRTPASAEAVPPVDNPPIGSLVTRLYAALRSVWDIPSQQQRQAKLPRTEQVDQPPVGNQQGGN